MNGPAMPISPVQTRCFHCGQSLSAKDNWERVIAGESRRFCCPSCATVCSAVFDAGLEGFYERMPQDATLTPPTTSTENLALYDLDDVQAEFVDSLGRNRHIHLLVEGIHCAACVWLIERTLASVPGIIQARVNLSARRVLVEWDNDAIHLSKIMAKLASIGYTAAPYQPEMAEASSKKQHRALLLRMAFAGFAMMNLMWVSIALYSGADQGEFRSLFHWVGLALATLTLFYSGYPFLKGAVLGLRHLHLSMDLPIAIGASATYAYSVYITVSQSTAGEVYFDTVVNFLFVILVGRYLEATAKRHAVISSQRLLDLQPRGAIVLRDSQEVTLPIRAVKVGDTVVVKAGDKIPVDGEIIEGQSAIDEAMLSGESLPIHKGVGDNVSAGTINLHSTLLLRVNATLKDTALGRIIRLVEDAQQSKAAIQCLTDRIVPWFILATLSLASITFFLWLHTGLEHALITATAVLIITCPCALGLATPMSMAVASDVGARLGVLIKSSDVLESLSNIQHIIFDKTGTLTEGQMSVHDVWVDGISREDALAMAAALESRSEHSIAKAFARSSANNLSVWQLDSNSFCNHPGQGVSGLINGQPMVLGNLQWLKTRSAILPEHARATVDQWESQGISCVYLAMEQRIVAVFGLADQLRADARPLVDTLRQHGIRMTLLTGDRLPVAQAIAQQLGGMEVIAEVLPEAKEQVIRQCQQRGERVAMVGDGINDAPALMRADVGIAIGSGTDVSIDSAQIVLMRNELHGVWLAKQLADRTLKTIRQNLRISLTYNSIMVPLAMMAMVTPLLAAIVMPISSLAVITNSARIRRYFAAAQQGGKTWK
ncbi:MAG: heavy metal translocating P-type ATPase [Gammaproteobacteria bacterium]|nr:heavy metal translocating P-type ATPase [Gammaproteobacteria bacterium]